MNKPFKIPYFNALQDILKRIESTQTAALEKAACAVATCLEKDGIIHTFGCGHSSSLAIETFYRSGCFGAVNAILDPGLMFQCGAHASTAFERLNGYGNIVLKRHSFQPQDVLFVFSNSGKNPAGIEAVFYAKEQGASTLAITAAAANAQTKSRHASGKLLKDVADIVIDNCCSANETALELQGTDVAPVSTLAGAAILHAIFYRAAEMLTKKGIPLPVYKSSNAGGDAHNALLGKKYAGRIKHLN